MVSCLMRYPARIEIERGREGLVVVVQPTEIDSTVGQPVDSIQG